MLKKFWGWEYTIGPDTWLDNKVHYVDTMLLSKLVDPDRRLPDGFVEQWEQSYVGEKLPGPHSLEVWGYRLGIKKPKLVYGDKMGAVPYEISVAQATADVIITKALYFHLLEEVKKRGTDLRKASAVEKKVRFIISEGAQTGVPFDSELAERNLIELDSMMEMLAEQVEPELPLRMLPNSKIKRPPLNPLNKDGKPSKNAWKYWTVIYHNSMAINLPEEAWFVVYPGGKEVPLIEALEPLECTGVMSISDSKDIKEWLIHEHGWVPTFFNTKKDENGKKIKTSPKFHEKGKFCPNLESLGETVEVVKKVVQYLSYRNRRSVIKSKDKDTGWLNHPRLKIDGRLPADADTMGANTFRFTHRVVANLPRVTSIFGEEMRGMYIAPPGYKMVGWDAASLEDRCKAHYCYDMPGGVEYAEKLLDPSFNVHEENMKAWELPKDKCKNGHYAMQYNCRPPKLAETLGIEQARADEYYEAWWANNQPLRLFLEKISLEWLQHDSAWLPGIDNRWVPCPYEYMTVSRLFQSAGVIAMKYAMVLWYNKIKQRGLDAVQVIHYHDEAQSLVIESAADEVGEIGCWSIKRAGQLLNFKVPLLSDYKIGDSWAGTH